MKKFGNRLTTFAESLLMFAGSLLMIAVMLAVPGLILYLLLSPLFGPDPLRSYIDMAKSFLGFAAIVIVVYGIAFGAITLLVHLCERFAVVRGLVALLVLVFGASILMSWCSPHSSDYCKETRFVTC